jgi:SnoaL-like protein
VTTKETVQMTTTTRLSEAAVKKLVDDWYLALDVHAPVDQLVPLLASSGLEMYWPEGPTFGVDEFKGWYDRVTKTFFDEIHTMKELVITPRDDEADVKLVVNWQARVWNPPDAKSKWLGMDARQSWVVRSEDGRPVIKKYVVDGLDPMEGSASL